MYDFAASDKGDDDSDEGNEEAEYYRRMSQCNPAGCAPSLKIPTIPFLEVDSLILPSLEDQKCYTLRRDASNKPSRPWVFIIVPD